MESFLITSSYRKKNKTIIRKLSIDNIYSLEQVAELKITNNQLLPNPYDYAAWGIARVDGGYITSEANGLRLLDDEFNTMKRYQNVELFRDLHSLSLINNKLYIANTGCDKIEVFDTDFNKIKSIDLHRLPYLEKLKTISKKNPIIKSDCFHINFFSQYAKDIYFTSSFITKKEYKLKRSFPFVKKRRQTPGLVYNLSKKRVFINNLKAAHDGFWVDNKFWIVQSHNMTIDVYNETGDLCNQKHFKNGAFYRGLAVGTDCIIVGATRIDPNRTSSNVYSSLVSKRGGQFLENTAILILDKSNFDIIKRIDLPKYEGVYPEIYKIITVN